MLTQQHKLKLLGFHFQPKQSAAVNHVPGSAEFDLPRCTGFKSHFDSYFHRCMPCSVELQPAAINPRLLAQFACRKLCTLAS